MLTIAGQESRFCDGMSRRSWLRIGGLALGGLALPEILRAQAKSGARNQAKGIIMVLLPGGPTHLDMFDLKPDAPAEIRGEFRPIATRAPGVLIGEHLPRLAACADKFAIVRTLAHRDNNHLVATHHLLTGQQQPGAFFDKVASRDDWPNYAAGLDYLRPRHDGLPTGVNLPTFLMEGPLTWPGQHGGFLGPRHDPWQITRDPGAADFGMDSLRPAAGIDVNRLNDRVSLLEELDSQQAWLAGQATAQRLNDQQRLAFS